MNAIIFCQLLIAITSVLTCELKDHGEYATLTISIQVQKPIVPDVHFTAVCPLPRYHTCYITSFEPSPALNAAHHSGLKVCEKPKGTFCFDGTVVGGWVMNTYTFRYPEGTGLNIGEGTLRKYVGMRMHIFNATRFNALTDPDVWIKINISKKELKPIQSVFLQTTDGELPPRKNVKFDLSCVVPQGVSLQIVSYLGHTHELGLRVTGYVVKNCPKNCQWILIGQSAASDWHHQRFLPVDNQSVIANGGDILAARCTYFNSKNVTVNIGMLTTEEMCFFFIMGISNVDDDDFTINHCPILGNYTWESDSRLKNIPH